MSDDDKKDLKVDDVAVHVEHVDELDEELEKYLQTPMLEGLSDDEVLRRIGIFGRNEIPEKRQNPWLKFLGYFGGAISILIEVAAIISLVVASYIDFGILVGLLIINAIIGFMEEAKAESALDALKNTLALKSKAWRNGKLVEIDSIDLVPGDIIAVRLGDIVPADCRLLGVSITGDETEGTLQIDQSALTGESLPVAKGKGAIAYSSSICKQGQMLAVVTKTGIQTFIGRAANLISITTEAGHFQKIINHIGNFLIIITVTMAVIILLISFFLKEDYEEETYKPIPGSRRTFLKCLEEVVVLTIAAIPVGLPTVLSVTMAVGASQLAKKQVIVKRLTAIEELASVSILCSDKTGTLTLNRLTFDEPYLAKKGNTSDDFEGTGVSYTAEELLLNSYFSSEPGAHDPIESAVRKAAETRLDILQNRIGAGHDIPGYKVNSFIPFNPSCKYTEARVTNLSTGEVFKVIKGAPQVISNMCGGHSESTDAVFALAMRGLRALGVARTVDEEMTKFEMVGMISLLDPPRHDSAETIRECQKLGVQVKMITGDQQIIGKEVAHRLGMNRTILDATKLNDPRLSVQVVTECIEKADGFAQVIPEDKYKVVELLQNAGYLVGMTGDGVNDAPALKKANVGIAVEGCTDAARSAADIVLLAAGLSTIVDGIKTSRAIFQRMRSYALYRIASTIHFLLFFFISILAYDFTLPNRLVLMICILNDAATLVIAIDNARISKRPDKWRLGQLMTLSFVLGVLLCVISFAHFFVAKFIFEVPVHELQTIMYLQISSCPHFVIFSTRVSTYFWKSKPSLLFVVVIFGTQVIAMIMSVYGLDVFHAKPIGWAWACAVMAVSIVSFMVLDLVKVFVIKQWSFELTAKLWPSPKRKMELCRRQDRAVVLKKYRLNVGKLRKVCKAIYATKVLRQGQVKAVGAISE